MFGFFQRERRERPSLDTAINYIITYEKEHEDILTPFRGFHAVPFLTSPFLQVIAHLPSNVLQFGYDSASSVGYRSIGFQPLQIGYCPIRYLGDTIDRSGFQFPVVLFEEKLRPEVDEQLDNSEWPVLSMALPLVPGDLPGPSQIDPVLMQTLGRFVANVVDLLAKCEQPKVSSAFRAISISETPWRRDSLAEWSGIPTSSVSPSNTVLSTMGYKIVTADRLRELNNEPFFEAMSESADQVLRERQRLFKAVEGPLIRTQNDMLLAAPTTYGELRLQLDRVRKWGAATANPIAAPEFRKFLDIVKRQKGFIFGAALNRDELNFLQSASGQSLMALYGGEIKAVTAYLSVLAADSQAPLLRWAPDIADAYDPLATFAEHYRAEELVLMPISGELAGTTDETANKEAMRLFGDVQDAMHKATPAQFMERMESGGSAKIVSDLPLEWLSIDGLPLMFAKETSRLPITPGMLMQQVLSPETLRLRVDQCRDVLILTGFKKNESDLLKTLSVPDFRFIEPEVRSVRTTKDVLKALDKFEGPLVIFDMHGRTSNDLTGELILPGGRFSPYRSLVKSKCSVRVPPLVILSACDTLAVDSPSGAAAYGFLLAGAYSVLATFLPVYSGRGGLFIMRLLHRYDEFLSRLRERSHPVRWRQLVWDTQRIMYTTELFLVAQFSVLSQSLGENEFTYYSNEVGAMINDEDPRFPGDKGWFDHAVDMLSDMCSMSREDMMLLLGEKARFVDAMNYVQVGFPERVLIMTNAFEQAWPQILTQQWQEAMNAGSPG